MVQLYLQKDRPFDEGFLGVVITGSERQRHTGIVYRTSASDPVHFLHLAFHYWLARDGMDSRYCWLAVTGLDEIERQSFAIWLDQVWEQNGKNVQRVPYGIKYGTGPHWNTSGAFVGSTEDGGLTCSTFVLSLFDQQGFTAIDVATSYRRDDDVRWQEWIIGELKTKGGATDDYVERQRDFIGIAARYRPEEVAGVVSLFNGLPKSFDEAIACGEQVLAEMRSVNGLRP